MTPERWMVWSLFFVIGIPVFFISAPNGLGMMLAGIMVLLLVGTEK